MQWWECLPYTQDDARHTATSEQGDQLFDHCQVYLYLGKDAHKTKFILVDLTMTPHDAQSSTRTTQYNTRAT